MPKAKASAATATRHQKVRRSTRLSGRNQLEDSPQPEARRHTRKRAQVTVCHATRRSERISPAELAKRELALIRNEQDLRQRTEEQLLAIKRQQDEANMMLIHAKERDARATLSLLEEHFTCALCYEILAHPYTLNPGSCGHTFCGICILKWFFSRLHKACGGWHESVDCPICRSLLVITPDRTPRLDITFPFVPNRLAAAVLESLIDKLADATFSVKREDSEGLLECRKTRSKSKDKEDTSSDLSAWRDGGFMRTEWLKKDRDGKREMGHLFKFWTTMRSQEFVAIKQKLGV